MRKLIGNIIMIFECIRMSLEQIRGNKVRSFLTLLGIMIGVTAVITLISTVSGVSGSLTSSFTSMGAGTLTVSVSGSDLKSGLTQEDLDELAALDSVRGIVPNVSGTAQISYGGKTQSRVTISGKSAYYFFLQEDLKTRGRNLNSIDDTNVSFVCMMSQNMVDTFFFGVDPLGETVFIAGMPFVVVGLYGEDKGSGVAGMFSSSPDFLIPYTTALKMNNQNAVTSFTVYLTEGTESEEASQELENSMDAMFSWEEDCFTITTMSTIEETMATMTQMMTTLLAGIASIALVVGGIGIMNMMLTTVTERTQEIGIKMALGARQWQIQVQFLIESFLLSMFGGILGVVFGLFLSYVLCSVMGTEFVFSMGAVVLGVSFSAAVGILFGWAPARKASRLNPIDALRSI
ncbi:MAG: ABC transporter permease [Clostridia bacterium]|nr:ABC transporter permease [Clostridia bacterium]